MQSETATALRDGEPFLLGKWLVEPTLNRLTRGTTSVQLELKAMDVLLCLVERAGEVVSKNDLLDAVWQTEFVSDNTLVGRIAEIRDALGDDAQSPTFIETIRKRGYRLIAEVVDAAHAETGIPPLDESSNPDEERNPYPGLAVFSEEDAENFFGREKEIAALWRKITSRRLLAVIGPSGIGKSSLLRAGVATRAPPRWRVLVTTPGDDPAMSLARALAPDHAGDPSAVSRLLGFNEPYTALAVVSRWRGQFDEVVLVVDQFEELFTLCPPDVQSRFIELLRRLVDAADIHVVLSMRDDYLHKCQRFPEIAPIFDGLTPLGAPDAEGLRRAVTEPAARLMHRFSSVRLVDRMIAEVEDQRGALPLLAFAVRRLWEERDSENRLLTEEAYEAIGGVAGALARHAEAIMGEIGHERLPIVREIFRNLVTAEGTRAVRNVDELLSVFNGGGGEGVKPSPKGIPQRTVGEGFIPSRDAATEVLGKLIDARLLTSFETHDDAELSTHRVEIVHESLLAAWPRLVRWQTQDQESAQLRDELRQAAKIWDEHGRHDDRLWTGTAYREFLLWRERYPGGLTEVEEAFAESMSSFANRRSRRRVYAVAASFIALLVVLVVVGSFWRRSENETRRAEAADLLSRGRVELESYPSATVAYAIASLELADGPGARQLAQEALWKGPTTFLINEERSWHAAFSPDGQSLVQAGDGTGNLRLIHTDGGSELLEHRHESDRINIHMGLETGVFFSNGFVDKPSLPFLGLWSVDEGRLIGGAEYEGPVEFVSGAVSAGKQRLVYLVFEGGVGRIEALGFDGRQQSLGSLDFDFEERWHWLRRSDLERRTGRWLGAVANGEVLITEIGDHGLSDPQRVGHHEEPVTDTLFDPTGRFFATAAADGRIRLWDIAGELPPVVLEGPPGAALGISDDGSLLDARVNEEGTITSWVWSLDTDPPRLLRPFDLGQAGIGRYRFDGIGWQVAKAGPDPRMRLWPMAAPAAADPLFLLRGDVLVVWSVSFHPNGHWLASADKAGLAVWPLARPYPSVIRRHEKMVCDVVFGPEGRWLASSSMDDTVRLWPLEGDAPLPGRILLKDTGKQMYDLARTPDGEQLLVGTGWSGVRLLSLSGEESETVPDIGPGVFGATISPDGRLGAGVESIATAEIRIRVWDLPSGKITMNLRPDGRYVKGLQFTNDGHLLSASEVGLHRWNLETGESELLYQGNIPDFAASDDGTQIIVIDQSGNESSASRRPVHVNLETGNFTTLETHGTRINTVALGPQNDLVITGDTTGMVRVGPITGEEPHLLLGHENTVWALDFDPLGRWIASGGNDGTVRLWPMPDLSTPPLHTLPHDELIAKLKTLTNLRVVRDSESATGWTLTHDPFPGWETVPTW